MSQKVVVAVAALVLLAASRGVPIVRAEDIDESDLPGSHSIWDRNGDEGSDRNDEPRSHDPDTHGSSDRDDDAWRPDGSNAGDRHDDHALSPGRRDEEDDHDGKHGLRTHEWDDERDYDDDREDDDQWQDEDDRGKVEHGDGAGARVEDGMERAGEATRDGLDDAGDATNRGLRGTVPPLGRGLDGALDATGRGLDRAMTATGEGVRRALDWTGGLFQSAGDTLRGRSAN